MKKTIHACSAQGNKHSKYYTDSCCCQVGVCLLQEAGPRILAASNLEELMMVMKEELPSLPHSRLEDVIRQAGSLNITR